MQRVSLYRHFIETYKVVVTRRQVAKIEWYIIVLKHLLVYIYMDRIHYLNDLREYFLMIADTHIAAYGLVLIFIRDSKSSDTLYSIQIKSTEKILKRT